MSKQRIKLVEVHISTHCHATEDIEKVKKAILNIVPEDLRPSTNIYAHELRGYYGNPIIRLETAFRGEDAYKVLQYIVSRLEDYDKHYLISSLEQRYDRKANKVYLRLNKQDAYLGKLVLYDGSDAIRVVASFSIVRSLDEVRKFFEELVEGSKSSDNRSPA